MKRLLCFCAVLAFCLGVAPQVFGSIAVTPADYTGSRTTVGTSGNANGLIWSPHNVDQNKDWDDGQFSIAWNISQSGSNYTYTYTVTTGSDGVSRLSHWILALSERTAGGTLLDPTWESIFVTKTQGNYTDTGIADVASVDVSSSHGGSNAGMPNDFYGVKFTRDAEVNQTIVTFTTTQAPVWGDFYARDGGGNNINTTVYAYNAGFGTDPAANATDFTNWIARPNGNDTIVPEPASILVWGGIAGLICFAGRRRFLS